MGRGRGGNATKRVWRGVNTIEHQQKGAAAGRGEAHSANTQRAILPDTQRCDQLSSLLC